MAWRASSSTIPTAAASRPRSRSGWRLGRSSGRSGKNRLGWRGSARPDIGSARRALLGLHEGQHGIAERGVLGVESVHLGHMAVPRQKDEARAATDLAQLLVELLGLRVEEFGVEL